MWFLQSPWPEQSLLEGVISRAAGLFIFIETLALALEHCDDPTELLKATLLDSASPGLTSLYGLYSSIVKARKVQKNAEFRRMIGVLLITAAYRPLSEETIAELAGVRHNLVKMWVADLSSMLYRDEGADGGIRAPFRISLSAMIVTPTLRSTSEKPMWNWVSLASIRWLNSSVSISANSKIPGLLIRM